MKTYTCDRCNGEGRIRSFNHVLGGICFKCQGSGKVDRKPAAPKMSKANPAILADNERKTAKAQEIYANDRRLRVTSDHAYFYAHARELAQLDGIWATL